MILYKYLMKIHFILIVCFNFVFLIWIILNNLFIFVVVFSVIIEFFSTRNDFIKKFENEIKPIKMHQLQNYKQSIVKFIAWETLWHHLMAKISFMSTQSPQPNCYVLTFEQGYWTMFSLESKRIEIEPKIWWNLQSR